MAEGLTSGRSSGQEGAEAWGPGLGHPAPGAVRPKMARNVGRGYRRTPGSWQPARDTFSAQVPCQAQPEEPGGPTLAWRHGAPGGATLQPSHPPACPDLLQTLCLASQHLPPASSLPTKCAFVFLPEPCLPWRQSSKGGGVLETSLCPLQPDHALQPWRGCCGRPGPWGGRQAGGILG